MRKYNDYLFRQPGEPGIYDKDEILDMLAGELEYQEAHVEALNGIIEKKREEIAESVERIGILKGHLSNQLDKSHRTNKYSYVVRKVNHYHYDAETISDEFKYYSAKHIDGESAQALADKGIELEEKIDKKLIRERISSIGEIPDGVDITAGKTVSIK